MLFFIDRRSKAAKQVQYADTDHKSICVLTGPRGCGKTAIVSGWLTSQQCQEAAPRGTLVISHYSGCDRMARDVSVFMKRCIVELRRAFAQDYGQWSDHLIVHTQQLQMEWMQTVF